MVFIYAKLLTKHPIKTKLLTSGFIFSFGDAITQIFIQKVNRFSYENNFKRFIVGSIYMGTSLHFWYCKLLPKLQNIVFQPNTRKVIKVFGSVLLTQLIFSPFLIFGFFFANQFVKNPQKKGIQNGIQQCKLKYLTTLKCNWVVWSIATGVNLWFFPIQYQVLFSNIVGFFWSIFLCYITTFNRKNQ